MPDESDMSLGETVRHPVPSRGAIELPRFGSMEITQTADFSGAVYSDVVNETAGSFIGHYQLMEELGEGGFGIVWRAEQLEPIHREVALKVIKPGMDSREIIARFEAERQTLALMDHPNIAGVLDAGTTRLGRPYFVMELVKGVPITTYCDTAKLTIRERVELFIPVCKAVQHAHQKSILHRDLKPSNILVGEVDGKPVPKVIDFGIAKAMGGSPEAALQVSILRTQEGAVVGTPQYMSPEQAGLVGDMDTRSDIYTLGVILYELLAGGTPLSREAVRQAAMHDILRLIRENEPIRPSNRVLPSTEISRQTSAARSTEPEKLNRALAGDLDWITLKAIEKERDRRYESASALAQDLERYLGHEPVEAGPPSPVYRLRKMVRRNRLAVASSFMILLLLIAGVAVSTSQAVRAMRAEDLAIERLEQVTAERRRTAQSLSRADHRQAVKYLAEDQASKALAHLAHSIRTDPSNAAAAAALTSVLAQRNWALPLGETRNLKAPTRMSLLSRHGEMIASASTAGDLALWDFESGKPLAEWTEHLPTVGLFGLNQQGTFLVASVDIDNEPDKKGGVRVWEIATGRSNAQPFPHGGDLGSLAVSPDGRQVVTASGSFAQLWDVASGTPVGEPIPMEAKVYATTFSPDGTQLLMSAWNTAHLWNIQERALVGEPMSHSQFIEFVAFSPDGTLVVTSAYDKTICIWDARTGIPVIEPIPHASAVVRMSFSPDGRRILSVCEDHSVRIFDASTGRMLSEPMRHGRYVTDAAFSSDGRRVLTVSSAYDQALMTETWDAVSGAMLAESIRHTASVASASFSPDEQIVATASADGTARLWKAADATPLTEPLQHDGPVHGAVFNGDGSMLATWSEDGTTRLWDVKTGTPIGVPLPHEAPVLRAAFSPDGSRIATASKDKSARIWDVKTGKELAPPLQHEDEVNFVSFSPDGQRVVTASTDNTARVWNAGNGSPITEPMRHGMSGETGGQGVQSAVFSPDGALVLTSSKDYTARLWDARSGDPVGTPLQHHTIVNRAVFSRDGRFFATAAGEYGKPGFARIWKTENCNPVTEPLLHSDGVVSVSFSPGDLKLVTASYDKTARLWDVLTGWPVSEPLPHEGFVTSASFGNSARRVLTSTWDGETRVWDLPEECAPVPLWLADLAEAVAGSRLNEADVFVDVPQGNLLEARATWSKAQPTDPYSRFARWFFSPRATRAISPRSAVTIPQYVDRRLQEGTELSAEGAYRADPGRQEVWKLLQSLKEQSP